MPLNETHRALLQAAAEREDRLITAPETLKPRAMSALAKMLIGSGCAVEVPVGADQPSWGEVEGGSFGLQLAPAGLAEIGLVPEEPTHPADAAVVPAQGDAEEPPVPVHSQPLRPHTKLALVVGLLQRPDGATLDDLVCATGWLAHSTRAALTGLRKRGYALDRDKSAEGETRYRLRVMHAPSAAAAASSKH